MIFKPRTLYHLFNIETYIFKSNSSQAHTEKQGYRQCKDLNSSKM